MTEPIDEINIATAMTLIDSDVAPMATCPADDEPLVCTFRFPGAEFICVVCDQTYGFLSPKPAVWTQALQDRHDELRATFEARYA